MLYKGVSGLGLFLFCVVILAYKSAFSLTIFMPVSCPCRPLSCPGLLVLVNDRGAVEGNLVYSLSQKLCFLSFTIKHGVNGTVGVLSPLLMDKEVP